jgi:uncharacterized protein (TIGR03435 family)
VNFIQDRQVVDETGLTGRFNFALMIPTNTAYGRQGPDDMDRATAYFGAVQPLGFKISLTSLTRCRIARSMVGWPG